MKKLLIAVGIYLAAGAAVAWWLSSRGAAKVDFALNGLLWPVRLFQELFQGKAAADEGEATDAEKASGKSGGSSSLVVKTDAEKAADAKADDDRAAAEKLAADKAAADKEAATKAAADAKPSGGSLADTPAERPNVNRWDNKRKHANRN